MGTSGTLWLLAAALLCTVGPSVAQCDQDAVDRLETQLTQLTQDGNPAANALFIDAAEGPCRYVESVLNSTDRFVKECGQAPEVVPLSQKAQVLRQLWLSVCVEGDGRAALLEHGVCFEENRDAIWKCISQFNRKMDRLIGSELPRQEQTQGLCCGYRVYRMCLNYETSSACGKDAADFLDELVERTSGDIFRVFCNDHDGVCPGEEATAFENSSTRPEHSILVAFLIFLTTRLFCS